MIILRLKFIDSNKTVSINNFSKKKYVYSENYFSYKVKFYEANF